MMVPADVAAWRREQRARLIAARLAMDAAERRRAEHDIRGRLAALLDEFEGSAIGLYWPVRGEVDVLPLAETWLARRRLLALPAVAGRTAPLEYRRWHPGAAMEPGPFGIPAPADATPVRPDILLVPLVGFDDANYRLGYGAGLFDRTLAAAVPRPTTVGVGFEQGRLASIFPGAHDIALDIIATETGLRRS